MYSLRKLFRKFKKQNLINHKINDYAVKLEKLQSELNSLESDIILVNGRAEVDNRFNRFYDFNSIDFWMNDICVQSYIGVNDLSHLARLIHGWCELKLSGLELEKQFTGFKATEKMIMATSSTEQYLEYTWEQQFEYNREFKPLIKLLKEHPKTKKLMVYTQLFDLCLSRFIGAYQGVYINDLPRIRVIDNGKFKVMTREQAYKFGDINRSVENPEAYLGYGTAKEALEIIVKNLPENLEAARFMTKEDVDNVS